MLYAFADTALERVIDARRVRIISILNQTCVLAIAWRFLGCGVCWTAPQAHLRGKINEIRGKHGLAPIDD